MACYGPPRAEKGSDILQEAVAIHRRQFPASPARFTIHWTEDFTTGDGRTITKLPQLLRDPQVKYLTHYFAHGEYEDRIKQTQVMLLPYRSGIYGLRGSRVALEAVVNGIPVIAARGTSPAAAAESFGAGLFCEDGDPESLALAIREMETRYDELAQAAKERAPAAARAFSVESFRRTFLGNGSAVRASLAAEVAN
jgi:glycosyltransferase involved in cell wall biosynthesis